MDGTFVEGHPILFLKPQSTNDLIDDLIMLHARLVDLGMEYRGGGVYLADLEELENETV